MASSGRRVNEDCAETAFICPAATCPTTACPIATDPAAVAFFPAIIPVVPLLVFPYLLQVPAIPAHLDLVSEGTLWSETQAEFDTRELKQYYAVIYIRSPKLTGYHHITK